MSRNTALWPVGTSSESMLAFSKLIDPFLPSELCVSRERESPVFYLPSSRTANGPSCQRDSEITILNQLNTIASVNFQNNRTAQKVAHRSGQISLSQRIRHAAFVVKALSGGKTKRGFGLKMGMKPRLTLMQPQQRLKNNCLRDDWLIHAGFRVLV